MPSREQKEYPPGSHFRPVSDWFASCMDTPVIEELGATPLDPYLAKIEGIHDKVCKVTPAILHGVVFPEGGVLAEVA